MPHEVERGERVVVGLGVPEHGALRQVPDQSHPVLVPRRKMKPTAGKGTKHVWGRVPSTVHTGGRRRGSAPSPYTCIAGHMHAWGGDSTALLENPTIATSDCAF